MAEAQQQEQREQDSPTSVSQVEAHATEEGRCVSTGFLPA